MFLLQALISCTDPVPKTAVLGTRQQGPQGERVYRLLHVPKPVPKSMTHFRRHSMGLRIPPPRTPRHMEARAARGAESHPSTILTNAPRRQNFLRARMPHPRAGPMVFYPSGRCEPLLVFCWYGQEHPNNI
jgi:hypothetical protein